MGRGDASRRRRAAGRAGESVDVRDRRLILGAIQRRRVDALDRLLRQHARVAIAGGPRTGKTTLSAAVTDRPIIHTDDLMRYPWAEIPAMLIAEAALFPRFVIEGVQVPRALRKGLVVDAVLWLDTPLADRSKGQDSMAKGVASVFAEWRSTMPHVPVVAPDAE